MDWIVERGKDGMAVRLVWAPGLSEAMRKERAERERKARPRVMQSMRAWAIKRGLCDADGYLFPPGERSKDGQA
jgi:hypothetical protein